MSDWMKLLPESILEKYEVHNINHAAEILTQAYPNDFAEIVAALETFWINEEDLVAGGGSESAIPKKFGTFLHPKGWDEVKITGDLLVKQHRRHTQQLKEHTIENFIDGHNIDFVKGKVAFDLEWNSKDQTFDRDLYAFRTFHECGIIACGVIVTRSESLNQIFNQLGIKAKYGASTTWMGKLLPRIKAGRHGACPLLIIGITQKAMAR